MSGITAGSHPNEAAELDMAHGQECGKKKNKNRFSNLRQPLSGYVHRGRIRCEFSTANLQYIHREICTNWCRFVCEFYSADLLRKTCSGSDPCEHTLTLMAALYPSVILGNQF